MIDEIFAKVSEFRQRSVRHIAPEASVKASMFHHVAGSDKLVIVLPQWHAPPSNFKGYLRRLHKRGVSTLYFDLNSDMLQAELAEVVANFKAAAARIAIDVKVAQSDFTELRVIEFHVFSLSNALVGLLVDEIPIDTLYMILPGDNLAACLWYGIATKRIKHSFLRQGVNEGVLMDAWKSLDLLATAPRIAMVPSIHVGLAKGDKFIPYHRGRAFADALVNNHANVTIQEWRTGHTLALLRYLTTK